MAQGEPSSTPNYHLAQSKQPRHRRSPGERRAGQPGLPRLGSFCGGVRTLHAAIVLQRHGHAMGIQWATAGIPLGVILVPRHPGGTHRQSRG